MTGLPRAEIAVIGGSGFYELLDGGTEISVETPYGLPSAPVTTGRLGGRDVAFLPRHGRSHEFPPHRIPFRANLWALRELGVSRVFAPSAAGSLRADVHPGELVVCDQLIDRTSGRPDTYFEGPQVHHVSFADPYCPELRAVAIEAGRAAGVTTHGQGTMVVIQGPRFSTRAESRWFRSAGGDVIGMTQHPEAVLARELGMCYSALALITDYDTGVDGEETIEAVSMEAVFEVLRGLVDQTRSVLAAAIGAVPPARACGCAGAAPAAGTA